MFSNSRIIPANQSVILVVKIARVSNFCGVRQELPSSIKLLKQAFRVQILWRGLSSLYFFAFYHCHSLQLNFFAATRNSAISANFRPPAVSSLNYINFQIHLGFFRG